MRMSASDVKSDVKSTVYRVLEHAHESMPKSRASIHVPRTVGERVADTVANSMGSWRFIITQTVIVALWIVLNILAIVKHFDPYPFILLNLLFSTQAAYAAPVIMMSQNRQSQKDRLRDDHEADEVDLLYRINRQQLEILTLLREHLCPDAESAATVLPTPHTASTLPATLPATTNQPSS